MKREKATFVDSDLKGLAPFINDNGDIVKIVNGKIIKPYLLTEEDVCDLLQMGATSIGWRRRNNRSLPKYVLVGRFIRYKPEDVKRWINSFESIEDGGGQFGRLKIANE